MNMFLPSGLQRRLLRAPEADFCHQAVTVGTYACTSYSVIRNTPGPLEQPENPSGHSDSWGGWGLVDQSGGGPLGQRRDGLASLGSAPRGGAGVADPAPRSQPANPPRVPLRPASTPLAPSRWMARPG